MGAVMKQRHEHFKYSQVMDGDTLTDMVEGLIDLMVDQLIDGHCVTLTTTGGVQVTVGPQGPAEGEGVH